MMLVLCCHRFWLLHSAFGCQPFAWSPYPPSLLFTFSNHLFVCLFLQVWLPRSACGCRPLDTPFGCWHHRSHHVARVSSRLCTPPAYPSCCYCVSSYIRVRNKTKCTECAPARIFLHLTTMRDVVSTPSCYYEQHKSVECCFWGIVSSMWLIYFG